MNKEYTEKSNAKTQEDIKEPTNTSVIGYLSSENEKVQKDLNEKSQTSNIVSEIEVKKIELIPTDKKITHEKVGSKGKTKKKPKKEIIKAPSEFNDIKYLSHQLGYKFNLQTLDNPIIIGICGGACSGKSTLAKLIEQKFEQKIVVISQNNFYIPRLGNLRRKKSAMREVKEEELIKESEILSQTANFDEPGAIDWIYFRHALEYLKERKPFDIPIYDETKKVWCDETQKIFPSKVIIVEGTLIFYDETIRNLIDLKIFLDSDDDVRLSRRILKDLNKIQKSWPIEKYLENYLDKVKVCHDSYINPYKQYADMTIMNYGFDPTNNFESDINICTSALNMLHKGIEEMLAKKSKDISKFEL